METFVILRVISVVCVTLVRGRRARRSVDRWVVRGSEVDIEFLVMVCVNAKDYACCKK